MKIIIFNNGFIYLEENYYQKLKHFYINNNSILIDNINGHNTEFFYNIILLPNLLTDKKLHNTNFYFNLSKVAISVDSDYIGIVYNEIKNYELLCNLAVEDYYENIYNLQTKYWTYYLVKILFQKDKNTFLTNKYSDYRVTFLRGKYLSIKRRFP
jgi:hypothetical protein